jgi:hypothetical protein
MSSSRVTECDEEGGTGREVRDSDTLCIGGESGAGQRSSEPKGKWIQDGVRWTEKGELQR